MTLVAASSTASESRSATGSAKPATSAIFFVTSRTRPRYAVSLGRERTRAGLLRGRGREEASVSAGRARASCPRPLTASGRPLGGPEAGDGLRLRGVGAVEVVEAQDVEDVLDGLVEGGEPEVAAVAPDLLDRAHDGPE